MITVKKNSIFCRLLREVNRIIPDFCIFQALIDTLCTNTAACPCIQPVTQLLHRIDAVYRGLVNILITYCITQTNNHIYAPGFLNTVSLVIEPDYKLNKNHYQYNYN